METKVKQVLVIRKDLKMRRGKEIAQGSHAAMMFLVKRMKEHGNEFDVEHSFSSEEHEWLSGSFTKICLQVENEKELMDVYAMAKQKKLEVHLVTDAGRTEFGGVPTKTCLAIGPDDGSAIDEVTSALKLY